MKHGEGVGEEMKRIFALFHEDATTSPPCQAEHLGKICSKALLVSNAFGEPFSGKPSTDVVLDRVPRKKTTEECLMVTGISRPCVEDGLVTTFQMFGIYRHGESDCRLRYTVKSHPVEVL